MFWKPSAILKPHDTVQWPNSRAIVYYHLASFGDLSLFGWNFYVDSMPLVILYYDYFLLFKEEIEFFWGSKLSWTAGLFLSTRYLALFGHLPVIFQALHPSSFNPKVCQPFKNYIVISNRIVAFIDVQSYTWFLLPVTLNCRVAATI